MGLMLLSAFFCGCATPDATSEGQSRTNTAPKRPNTWQRGDTVYEDRNGDGIVDYERRGHLVLDGSGFGMSIFIDDDYDGFYDREIAIDEGEDQQKAVHIAVPPPAIFRR